MVVAEGDMSSQGEVESRFQSDQQHKNHPSLSIGRQSSVYSLTLDEFQHTLCESGKNFGSMNMDEFLSSIWNAEENQAINSNTNINDASAEKGIRKQPSLPRQGSLTLPAPLCRKTVDEVWSEIHKAQQGQQHPQSNNDVNVLNTESTTRQPTFGEMTLEDFLVKAGVVGEPCQMPAPASHEKQYGLYPNNNSRMGPSVIGIGGGTGNVVGSYQPVARGGGTIGEPSGYPPPGVCHGGRVGNGGSGYGAGSRGMVAPVSSISSDGLATSEKSASQFGADMGVLRGRKRIIDGPVEKVVERRQRRMIKNRESAARSRARKQAYTVELEAELNHLREQNAHLKQALAELERRRKQQCFEELNGKVHNKAQKAKEKLRALRRNTSCPL